MSTRPENRVTDETDTTALCEKIGEAASRHRCSIATAESLTAGNMAAMLGKATSAGEWYRGGIVAYHEDVKHFLLEVPSGPVVSERSAAAMASSTARLMNADLVVAVTGEAGPESQEDEPPGSVWFGMSDCGVVTTEHQQFEGDPESVLAQTLSYSLTRLLEHLQRKPPA